MITAIFRDGPLDGRTLQIESAPRELFVESIVHVLDGNATRDECLTDGAYVIVEATEISFIRRTTATDARGVPVWAGFSSVADGVVYAWDAELLPNG